MGRKLVEKIFKIFLWMWSWKKTFKTYESEKTPFHPSPFKNGLHKS